MTTQTRYFYRKKDKLKSRKTIDLLFSKGHSFSNFPFKVIWLQETKETGLQAGVGVSSRHFKKATDRNRIKRLMREAYRLQKNTLDTYLHEKQLYIAVFILYIGKELPEYENVFEKFETLLRRLLKFIDENNQRPA